MSESSDGKWRWGLWTYYRQALKAINKDRWLIAIPLVPFVFDFIFFRLPMQLQFVRAMDPGLRAFYSHRDLFTPVWLDFAFWRRLFHRLPYAPGNLHAAYFSLFIDSELVLALTLLSAILVTTWGNTLKCRLPESDQAHFVLVRKTIIGSASIVLIGEIILWFLRQAGAHAIYGWAVQILGDDLVMFGNVAMASLIEAGFLIKTEQSLKDERIKWRILASKALKSFRPLFQLNLAILLAAEALIFVAKAKGRILIHYPSMYGGGHWNYLQILSALDYLRFWIIPATLLMPFVLVLNQETLQVAWRRHWRLISVLPGEYFLLILSGGALWFISETIIRLGALAVNPLSFLFTDLSLLFGSLQVVLMSWFYLTVFIWFLDKSMSWPRRSLRLRTKHAARLKLQKLLQDRAAGQ